MSAIKEIEQRIDTLLVDPEIARLIPGLETVIEFTSPTGRLNIQISSGSIGATPATGSASIVLDASEGVWEEILKYPPAPTYHSFTALQLANDGFSVDGDPLAVAQARPVLERIFELLVSVPAMQAPVGKRNLRQVAGHYIPIEIGGVTYEIYYEEAGRGTPVLFLHTAGADGRQFLPQLSDIELAKTHRLIAVDLPYHGRSLPPQDWDGSPYKLTSDTYMNWCSAIIENVVGDRAIVAGGSMGAAMSMVLAAARPEQLLGIIAIEPPFRSKGRKNPFQHHTSVHGSLHNSSYVRGIMSPLSPQASRRRASWIYSQGAPGIYPGDLSFYSEEFDGAVTAPKIDAARTPVVLLSGDYDYSATPADGAKLADLIPGSHHIIMEGLGHFPMCEHPDHFRSFLVEALDLIDRDLSRLKS